MGIHLFPRVAREVRSRKTIGSSFEGSMIYEEIETLLIVGRIDINNQEALTRPNRPI